MGCSKQVRRYSECQHDADPMYVYCGSEDHEDNDEENEACYQAQPTGRGNRSTIVTVIDEKYCSKACEAEFGIWICCDCGQSVIAPMERNTDVGSLAIRDILKRLLQLRDPSFWESGHVGEDGKCATGIRPGTFRSVNPWLCNYLKFTNHRRRGPPPASPTFYAVGNRYFISRTRFSTWQCMS